jgi:hypothetical protein
VTPASACAMPAEKRSLNCSVIELTKSTYFPLLNAFAIASRTTPTSNSRITRASSYLSVSASKSSPSTPSPRNRLIKRRTRATAFTASGFAP